MTEERKIRDALAACRVDSDDLAAPELSSSARALESDAQLRKDFEQGQQFDRNVLAVIHDVPVPDGLQDRLLEGLASMPAGDESQTVDPASRLENGKKPSRRHFILSNSVAIGLVAIVGFGVWMLLPSNQRASLTVAQVIEKSETGVMQARGARQWSLPTTTPAEYPIPDFIRETSRGWARVDVSPLDAESVVHNLTSPHEQEVYLLVARTEALTPELMPAPPENPQSNTGGWCSGAWRQGERVFVLVVKGSPQRYRQTLGDSAQLAIACGASNFRLSL